MYVYNLALLPEHSFGTLGIREQPWAPLFNTYL